MIEQCGTVCEGRLQRRRPAANSCRNAAELSQEQHDTANLTAQVSGAVSQRF